MLKLRERLVPMDFSQFVVYKCIYWKSQCADAAREKTIGDFSARVGHSRRKKPRLLYTTLTDEPINCLLK